MLQGLAWAEDWLKVVMTRQNRKVLKIFSFHCTVLNSRLKKQKYTEATFDTVMLAINTIRAMETLYITYRQSVTSYLSS